MLENVEKQSLDKLILHTDRYFLIYTNDKNRLLRINKTSLNEVYKIILDLQMLEGSYFIMKGNVVI